MKDSESCEVWVSYGLCKQGKSPRFCIFHQKGAIVE